MQSTSAAVSLLLLLLLGCATSPDGARSPVWTTPEKHVLGLLVPDGERVGLTVLERGVVAEHCGSSAGSSGNLAAAVESALASVGGANVLIHTSVYTRQRWDRVCVQVRGDAAALY